MRDHRLARLRAMMHALTPLLGRIGRFVLAEPERVMDQPVLAAALGADGGLIGAASRAGGGEPR